MPWGKYSATSLSESSNGNIKAKDLIVTGNIWLTGKGNIVLGKYSGNYDIPTSQLKPNQVDTINGTIILGPGKASSQFMGAGGKYSLEDFIQLLLDHRIVEYFNSEINDENEKNIKTSNIENNGTIKSNTIDIQNFKCSSENLYIHSSETTFSGKILLENGYIKNSDDNGDIKIFSNTDIRGDLNIEGNLNAKINGQHSNLLKIIENMEKRIKELESKS